MESVAVLALVLLMMLCAIGTAVAVAVLVARRLLLAARVGLGLFALRATSYGVGPRAEVARLRWRLRTEVDGARRACEVARVHGWPMGDAPMLVRRLDGAARGLDARLHVVGLEPRRDVALRALAGLRPEVEAVARAATGLREALVASGSAVEGGELNALAADCAVEARALRWR